MASMIACSPVAAIASHEGPSASKRTTPRKELRLVVRTVAIANTNHVRRSHVLDGYEHDANVSLNQMFH
jgi:hypothetical protein